MRRHWEIREDGKEGVDEVDGDGVVGFTPIFSSNDSTIFSHPTFAYSSCTHLSSPSGSMGGFFTFTDLETNTHFNAEVPTFILTIPSIVF